MNCTFCNETMLKTFDEFDETYPQRVEHFYYNKCNDCGYTVYCMNDEIYWYKYNYKDIVCINYTEVNESNYVEGKSKIFYDKKNNFDEFDEFWINKIEFISKEYIERKINIFMNFS